MKCLVGICVCMGRYFDVGRTLTLFLSPTPTWDSCPWLLLLLLLWPLPLPLLLATMVIDQLPGNSRSLVVGAKPKVIRPQARARLLGGRNGDRSGVGVWC